MIRVRSPNHMSNLPGTAARHHPNNNTSHYLKIIMREEAQLVLVVRKPHR